MILCNVERSQCAVGSTQVFSVHRFPGDIAEKIIRVCKVYDERNTVQTRPTWEQWHLGLTLSETLYCIGRKVLISEMGKETMCQSVHHEKQQQDIRPKSTLEKSNDNSEANNHKKTKKNFHLVHPVRKKHTHNSCKQMCHREVRTVRVEYLHVCTIWTCKTISSCQHTETGYRV